MNLLIITQYFYPERFVINELALDLSRSGHRVTVLTGMPNYPSGKFAPGYRRAWPMKEDYHGVRILRVPILPRFRGTTLQLFLNYMSFAASASLFAPLMLRDQIDAILVFEPSPITVGIPALVMKRLKSAPILFWVQDLWPDSLEATRAVKNTTALGAVARITRAIYRGSDIIMVQSRSFEPKIREIAPEVHDIRYLPNPADGFYRPISPEPNSAENKMLRTGFRIVFAGNMGAAQDLGTVLSAAEQLKDHPEMQWILIGDGRMRPWVEGEIRARGLDSNVQVLGPFPPEQMPLLFAHADALLVTLRKEEIFSLTIPSKIQAYLACGRPIVAALDGEGARIVEEAQAGFTCAAGDSKQLAAIVEKLHRLPKIDREAMGQAGRQYSELEFDRAVLVERLRDWLNEVAGKKK